MVMVMAMVMVIIWWCDGYNDGGYGHCVDAGGCGGEVYSDGYGYGTRYNFNLTNSLTACRSFPSMNHIQFQQFQTFYCSPTIVFVTWSTWSICSTWSTWSTWSTCSTCSTWSTWSTWCTCVCVCVCVCSNVTVVKTKHWFWHIILDQTGELEIEMFASETLKVCTRQCIWWQPNRTSADQEIYRIKYSLYIARGRAT